MAMGLKVTDLLEVWAPALPGSQALGCGLCVEGRPPEWTEIRDHRPSLPRRMTYQADAFSNFWPSVGVAWAPTTPSVQPKWIFVHIDIWAK